MIRDLGPGDLSAWRQIRAEGLRLFPEAFLTTLQEEVARSDEEVAESLAGRLVLGAFDDDRLIGTAALDPVVEAAAAAHRVALNAFYVSIESHGTGIGTRLLGAALDRAAADGKLQVELFVAAQNAPRDPALREARLRAARAAAACGSDRRTLCRRPLLCAATGRLSRGAGRSMPDPRRRPPCRTACPAPIPISRLVLPRS